MWETSYHISLITQSKTVCFIVVEYSADDMHPDPKKVQGIVIVEMTALQDKQQLHSFLGMVNNVENLIPHLSHHTEQDSVFHCSGV